MGTKEEKKLGATKFVTFAEVKKNKYEIYRKNKFYIPKDKVLYTKGQNSKLVITILSKYSSFLLCYEPRPIGFSVT